MEQKKIRAMGSIRFSFIIYIIILFASCQEDRSLTIKDLDETMIDLKAYQENLGIEIKAGRMKDAEWLAYGMDSVFSEIKRKFTEHRKLEQPFSYYYKIKMKKPIGLIKDAIRKEDTVLGMKGYRLLIKNCNSCHDDNNIDKTVKF
ncbi:MAG TPA: hypothetical protein VN451_06930 [Chitinophagaceae bacterium]|nr:hypothetical protein [Chitinophagaceae bacterium]